MMTDITPEERELSRWGIWTPTGSVSVPEYLASKPPVDQVKAKLMLLLDKPEHGVLARAFAAYVEADLDVLYAERHPRRRAAFSAEHRARATPPPIQEATQAMEGGENGDGHGEHLVETAGEHSEEPSSGERRRHTLTPPVAAMLRAARGRSGWSVRQAAGRLHLAVGMVSMMEAGTRAPSRQVAERVAATYQLTEAEAAQLLQEAVPGTGRDHRQATNGR